MDMALAAIAGMHGNGRVGRQYFNVHGTATARKIHLVKLHGLV
jgi:hypothetical protein